MTYQGLIFIPSPTFHLADMTCARVVSSIHDLVCDYAGRGFFQRLFCANNDLGSIAGFQQDLEQARKNFEVSIV